MAISPTLLRYLEDRHCHYEVVPHEHSHTSTESAHAARVPEDCMAKPVILHDDDGYLMAVLPASHKVDLQMLRQRSGRWFLMLAPESSFAGLFRDCEVGAAPPIGRAFGIETMVDDSLRAKKDVYFEAGDHEELIHMDMSQFCAMVEPARFAAFARKHH